jgi:pimeloyl-ACP methyl ester carboxylesterase
VTILLLLLIPLALLLIGIIYQALGDWLDARRFPPPGRMVDIGSCKLHLNQQGSGQPVVVLESGVVATSISWSLVQSPLAAFSTVCSYDRAGLGWSEVRDRIGSEARGPDGNDLRSRNSGSRTLDQMLSELDALLHNANLALPFVLVGHSFGGLLVRAFAHAYPERVAGLVLVDPVSLAFWGSGSQTNADRVRAGARLSRRGALLACIGVVRAALSALNAGGRWFPKQIAHVTARQGTGLMENLAKQIAKLPREQHSVVRAHWSRAKGFLAMAEYLEALPACAAAGLAMSVPAKIPVTILSAADATVDELRERDAWAAQSDHGRHIQVPETSHWIQLERPELIVAEVREMFGYTKP